MKKLYELSLEVEIVAVRIDNNLILCFFRQNDYTLAKGTTEVLSTNVKKIEFDVVNERVKLATGSHEDMTRAL
jgi:hypothetical protein